MTAKQGSKVRLDVRVTGIPTPVVKFYREGAEIQSSPDFQIVQDGDLYSLIIAEVYVEDSGTFSVTATNSVGRATSTAELRIQADEVKMEAHYEASASATEMIVDGRTVVQHLHHKTPPRIPPKPMSRSPTPPPSGVKVTRQQSPSPVRHVRVPAPSPVSPPSNDSNSQPLFCSHWDPSLGLTAQNPCQQHVMSPHMEHDDVSAVGSVTP
eukprot:g46196.t1